MTARKRQQRPRLPRKAASQPIIYEEDDSNGEPDSKCVRAPELDTCLEVVTSALSNPNTALLRRVFFIAEDKSKFVRGLLSCPRLSAASWYHFTFFFINTHPT